MIKNFGLLAAGSAQNIAIEFHYDTYGQGMKVE